jgi:predicted Zn-dependent protease
VLLVSLNREPDAYEILTRAKAASPDDPNLMLDRATVLALVGQSADAERELNRIELRWPEWSRAYLLHGLLLRTDATSTGRAPAISDGGST